DEKCWISPPMRAPGERCRCFCCGSWQSPGWACRRWATPIPGGAGGSEGARGLGAPTGAGGSARRSDTAALALSRTGENANRAARHYYFIGKDNIVFHTLFWPAILMGTDEKLTLPYDVPATQFLNFSGERMSTGRGRGIWLSDLLERFDPDQLRYYGIATMP